MTSLSPAAFNACLSPTLTRLAKGTAGGVTNHTALPRAGAARNGGPGAWSVVGAASAAATAFLAMATPSTRTVRPSVLAPVLDWVVGAPTPWPGRVNDTDAATTIIPITRPDAF